MQSYVRRGFLRRIFLIDGIAENRGPAIDAGAGATGTSGVPGRKEKFLGTSIFTPH